MANEFINVNDIIDDINTVMVENNDGDITAADMNAFLIKIANRLKTAPQHLGFITGLTGGTSSDLDAVDTDEIDAASVISVSINGRHYEYELCVGTGEESELSPFIIIPDEYHNKYWRRRDVIAGTFQDGDLGDENELLIAHNARTLYVQIWVYDCNDEIVHGKQWLPGPDPEMNTTLDMGGEISGVYKYVLRW